MEWGKTNWGELDEEPEVGTPAPEEPQGRPRRSRWALVLLGVAILVVGGTIFAFRLSDVTGSHLSAEAAETGSNDGRLVPLSGPRTAVAPSTYTLRGRTASTDGAHNVGPVILRGRWNGGTWLVFATSHTDAAGNFSVTSKLRRRGVLELRLSLPDGFTGAKTIRVK